MMWGTTPVLLAGDTWCSDTAALFAGLCHCPTHCWMAPLLSPPWFSFMGSLEASPISSLWPSSWWYRLSARWVTVHLLGISRTFLKVQFNLCEGCYHGTANSTFPSKTFQAISHSEAIVFYYIILNFTHHRIMSLLLFPRWPVGVLGDSKLCV